VGTGKATGDTNCAWDAIPGGSTSPDENADWTEQSIVQTGATFSYPKTAMSAWLCASVYNGQKCAAGTNPQYCMNNSSAQGQLFYQNITNPSQPYAVYAVQNCDGPEGVNGQNAVVPGWVAQQCTPGQNCGFAAISYDMAWDKTKNPNGCHKIPNP
jgi:hypothetical protein